MLLAVAVALPATSMDAHAASHLASSVDATEHHHHADDGRVVADHDHEDSTAPDADGDDGGHAHMPTQTLGFDAPGPVAAVALIRSLPSIKVEPSADRPPPDIEPSPHNRPPRFA